MKADELTPGHYKVGTFDISVQPTSLTDYFHVLLTEHGQYLYYIHLNDDERFGIFKHMQVFSRNLTEVDVAEYNSYVSSVFHKIAMPTFLLHRSTIVSVLDTCTALTKKIKKGK